MPKDKVLLKFDESFKLHRTDLSAILLDDEKHLWLGSDETSSIERLTQIDAENFAEHKHFRIAEFMDLPMPEECEVDVEGLAISDDYLWFTGSHSYKRKRPKTDFPDLKNIARLSKIATEPNRYVIGRIPLVDGELHRAAKSKSDSKTKLTAAKLELHRRGNALMKALADDVHLGAFVRAEIAGKDNGFDIEGLAVSGHRVFLGLRGPVLRGWAVIIEIALEECAAGLLKLKKISASGAPYKKHFVNLSGLGIRDLCVDGEDFLILAGPTMDLSGPVHVYRLENALNLDENALNRPALVKEIPFGKKEDHAEGITLTKTEKGAPALLTVYDSPAQNRLIGDDSILADLIKL